VDIRAVWSGAYGDADSHLVADGDKAAERTVRETDNGRRMIVKTDGTLLRVMPPRLGEHTLLSFENLLESLDADEPFSLELVAEQGGVSMLVRSEHPDRVAQQLRAHYPEVGLQYVEECDDPMRFSDEEIVWMQRLRPEGSEWLPLQVYDDTGLLDYGSDPFVDMLGGLSSDVRPGERLVSRLVLSQMSHDWSEAWRARAMIGAGSENQKAAETERVNQQIERTSRGKSPNGGGARADQGDIGSDSMTLWILYALVGAMAALLVGMWFKQLWESGQIWQIALYGVVGTAVTAGILFLFWKLGLFRKIPKQEYYDPQQVATRISGAAFRLEVQLFAVVNGESRPTRSRELLEPVVGAYRGFDNPLGCRFGVGELVKVEDAGLNGSLLSFEVDNRKWRLFRQPDVRGKGIVGVREVAALWHVPGESAKVDGLERAGSRRLPLPRALGAGALVGEEIVGDGETRLVHFPPQAMRRHHLYAARTQMGKSTLMGHVVGSRLLEKAAGRDDQAVVVVDPHADLVGGILQRVPEEVAGRVRLIDLGDKTRRCGINLLDVHVFLDRETTVDTIVRVARALWDQWGGRMQTILEHTLKALYEANKTLRREEQYTLLDGRLMLTDEGFRNGVLRRVRDPFILNWWQSDFGGWRVDYLVDAVAPVQTRLAQYAGSAAAREILGQRSCTLDVGEAIRNGDVLLVSTDQGAVGRHVSALVGAAMLNLVELVVRQEGERMASERGGAMVVVDEMQTIPGVEYEDMLSELLKYRGSLVLATQSLSRLDELSPTMRDSILANAGCLCVFQVNAVDAKRLLPELDSERLDEEDITGLAAHNCYGRLDLGGPRPEYFSMRLLPPQPGNSAISEAIRLASDAYTRPQSEVAAEQTDYMDDQMRDFRDMLDRTGDDGLDFGQGTGGGRGGRRGRGGKDEDAGGENVEKDGLEDDQADNEQDDEDTDAEAAD